MLDKTYEDGIRAGLEMAVIIANKTGRGKITASAIMKEITTRQIVDDLAAKETAFYEFWKGDKWTPEQQEIFRIRINPEEKPNFLERLKKALVFKW